MVWINWMEWLEGRTYWRLAVLIGLCATLTGVLLFRTAVIQPGSDDWNKPWDHHKYVYMAEHPLGAFHIAPTSGRIGIPYLAGKLPLPLLQAFQIQNFLFMVSLGVFFYYVLRAAGYRAMEAWLGLLMLYSYGPATKLLLGNPYHPDAASFAITTAALYFLLSRQTVLLMLTLTMGALVKETMIMVIPLIYTLQAQRWIDVRLLLRTAVVGLPAVAVLAAIQTWIPTYNQQPSYIAEIGPRLAEVHLGSSTADFFGAVRLVMGFRLQQSPVNMVRSLTWMSVGILWLLPFFGLRSLKPGRATDPLAQCSTPMLMIRFLPFLALTCIGWAMALNEDRRFAYAFPFWIMAGINSLRELGRSWGIPMEWFLLVFGIQYGLNLLQPATPTVPFDIAAAVFALCLGIMFSFRDRLGGQNHTS